jgi:VIT1/CCC1 family predicted Fe2+/Mn2+ transporter
MKSSLKIGMSFGLTSGVITPLGLMVGLYSGTHSKPAVLGGILTIAIADALSDALGIHISEESKSGHTERHIWEATIATFVAKFAVAATFSVPVFFLSLGEAVTVSVFWGLSVLTILSVALARAQAISPWKVIREHLLIGVGVVAVTYYLGRWIQMIFG